MVLCFYELLPAPRVSVQCPHYGMLLPGHGHRHRPRSPQAWLTAELKRRWQMLQEMNCFFLSGAGTPKVWLITAFCTGSICNGREGGG